MASAPGTPADAELDRLVTRHAPWLLRWLERRVGRADAEDLVQEALLVTFSNRARIERAEDWSGYLLGIARNLVREHLARGERRREAEARRVVADSVDSAENEALEAALASLPEELEVALHVYYSRELTYEQAAEVLGVPRATFQSRLRRALTILREKLARERTGGG
jgi:RNA polymerase sigma-70 factor (ECF subfamily)